MSPRPPVIINLEGPHPPVGREWCATCAMLFLGDISQNPENQDATRRRVRRAEERGDDQVHFSLDTALTWRTLNLAVTTAPSVYFQMPMPVCWVHMQGYDPSSGSQAASSPADHLVNGRKGQVK